VTRESHYSFMTVNDLNGVRKKWPNWTKLTKI